MVLIVDPQIAGVSGDMLLCALIDLGADKAKIIKGIRSSSEFLPDSTIQKIDFEQNVKNGINATRLILQVDEDVSERTGADIRQAITSSADKLGLSRKAKHFAMSCIDSLICAESKIHGMPVDSVHFHEASGIDTLVDIIGVAISLEDLDLFEEEIICMPIAVGSGSVTFSHGTMSNPASAILEILRDSKLHICGSQTREEMTTPTGACILKNFVTSPMDYYPCMDVKSVGYGAGEKDPNVFSNTLKMVRGDTRLSPCMESIKILETNVDDVSGEVLGSLIEKIMSRGARDVSAYPGITKKNRPTHLIRILCDDDSMNHIIDALVDHTGTLGIRISSSERMVLPRTIHNITINIKDRRFDMHYKTASYKGKRHIKIEFDDLQNISSLSDMPLRETEYLIRKEIEKQHDKDAHA